MFITNIKEKRFFEKIQNPDTGTSKEIDRIYQKINVDINPYFYSAKLFKGSLVNWTCNSFEGQPF